MVFSHKSAVVEILVFFKKVQSRWRKWSKIEVEKTVFFYQVEKMGSPGPDVMPMLGLSGPLSIEQNKV